MAYLIDGNNVRNSGRDRRLGIPVEEKAFIRLCDAFARARRARITIIFDGPAHGRTRAAGGAWVRVLYSGARRSADDAIVQLVLGARAPRDLTVVTSDRGLSARVRDAGARVIGCRRFSEILSRAHARAGREEGDEKPEPGDTAFWERYFAGED